MVMLHYKGNSYTTTLAHYEYYSVTSLLFIDLCIVDCSTIRLLFSYFSDTDYTQ